MVQAMSRFRALDIGGGLHERACRGVVLAAAATLFLHDAATVGVSYTLRISYALLALACLFGAPFVLRGWRSAPVGVQLSAALLVLVYLVAGVVGVNPVVAVGGRGSSARWLVYLLDLGVGLSTIGLLLGLFRDGRRVRLLILALIVGAVLASIYGLYQWLAQHYGWPLANLDNAPNSDNFSTGARFQGLGLFGWERVRGTFVEPFAFGIYLAAMLPLLTELFTAHRRRSRLVAWVAALTVVGALLVTDSSLAWASLLVALAVVGAGAFISLGRPLLAGAAAAGSVLLAVLSIATLADPGMLSSVTQRSDSQLRLTVGARTDAWSESTAIWSRRPVLGYGPGASSVKLARADNAVGVSSAPLVLGSAYGIWAASLIDGGVLALLAWIVFFSAVLWHTAAVALRTGSALAWMTIAALLAAMLASQVGGDRLDLRVWVLVGVALTASRRVVREARDQVGGRSARA
jgi:hypothetical protein